MIFRETLLPHKICLLVNEGLMGLHVFSDGLILLAYLVIPGALIYLVWHKNIFEANYAFYLFSAFIFFCGVTHLMDIIVIYYPYYYLQGFIKLLTGFISILTALSLIPLVKGLRNVKTNEQFVDEMRKGVIRAEQRR